jgi:hypothetical protein
MVVGVAIFSVTIFGMVVRVLVGVNFCVILRGLEIMLFAWCGVVAGFMTRFMAGIRPVVQRFARIAIGICAAAELLGPGDGVAEIAQAMVAQRRLFGLRRRFRAALGCFRFEAADRFFQRQTLARDVAFLKRRIDAAQLIDQSRARTLIQRAAVLARVLVEACYGAGDQGIIVSHPQLFAFSFLSKQEPRSPCPFFAVLRLKCLWNVSFFGNLRSRTGFSSE